MPLFAQYGHYVASFSLVEANQCHLGLLVSMKIFKVVNETHVRIQQFLWVQARRDEATNRPHSGQSEYANSDANCNHLGQHFTPSSRKILDAIAA